MTTGRDIRLAQGEWQVAFDPSASALACAHAASGAVIEGVLSFQALRDDGAEAWRIVPSRDDVADRLALLAPDGNVQGYLAASVRGGVLSIRAVHRAAQAYRGTLRFRGTARLGADTFACRTRAPEAPRVVQMAAGPADSGLNDSLFDIPTDAVLRLGGDRVSITTVPAEEGKAPAFGVALTARPETAARSALTFELERGYYRSRYVPHYSPIDKTRCPSPPTGWMSWNVYFDTAGEEENLAEARVGAEHLQPFGLEFWSIESWQDNSDTLPVSQFHNLTLRPHPGQFPHGMKWLADEIRALGFRPGIWTVPFGTGDEAFYAEHREWFLHDADGQPLHNWCGRTVLDPSQPAVRQHMEDTHRTMAEDWGYEFFKIDGMSGRSQGYSAHFYERDDVRATFREPCDAPFALCVEALRRGIGPDRVWLACQGHYTGPEVPYADAGRIGADIVHPNQPPKWHNILHQAEATLNQLFAHNVVWYGDPDTLLVGEFLPLDVARIATIVVGLPGQVTFAGDKLAALPPERMRLLQQCLPVCDVRPLDLYPLFDRAPVWDLKVRRPFAAWDVVALFNWSDAEAETGFAFAELGLEGEGDYLLYDFWGERFLGAHSRRFAAPLAPRSSLLLAVHPALGRPQLVSTDRHITQGATSLDALHWDDASRTLSGTVRLVAGVATTLVVHLPEGFVLSAAEAGEAQVVSCTPRADGTLALTLHRGTPGAACWRLRF